MRFLTLWARFSSRLESFPPARSRRPSEDLARRGNLCCPETLDDARPGLRAVCRKVPSTPQSHDLAGAEVVSEFVKGSRHHPMCGGGVVQPPDRVAGQPVGTALQDDELGSRLPGEFFQPRELILQPRTTEGRRCFAVIDRSTQKELRVRRSSAISRLASSTF